MLTESDEKCIGKLMPSVMVQFHSVVSEAFVEAVSRIGSPVHAPAGAIISQVRLQTINCSHIVSRQVPLSTITHMHASLSKVMHDVVSGNCILSQVYQLYCIPAGSTHN